LADFDFKNLLGVDAFKGTVGWFQLFKKEVFIEGIRYFFCALNSSITNLYRAGGGEK